MAEEKENLEEKIEATINGKILEEKENTKKEDLKKDEKISLIKQNLEETTDRLKRVMAEFENYKKRNSKERELLYQSLVADIISAFLPVMDNLEKAVDTKTEDEAYKQGIELLLKQFSDVLVSFGIEKINSIGESFDPEIHEAVCNIQDENLGEKVIKEEFRKGYKIGNKVIRHAMVSVAN